VNPAKGVPKTNDTLCTMKGAASYGGIKMSSFTKGSGPMMAVAVLAAAALAFGLGSSQASADQHRSGRHDGQVTMDYSGHSGKGAKHAGYKQNNGHKKPGYGNGHGNGKGKKHSGYGNDRGHKKPGYGKSSGKGHKKPGYGHQKPGHGKKDPRRHRR
jgi:hypothetical protein